MKPFDLQLILGNDNTGKELAKINIDFELKSQKVL